MTHAFSEARLENWDSSLFVVYPLDFCATALQKLADLCNFLFDSAGMWLPKLLRARPAKSFSLACACMSFVREMSRLPTRSSLAYENLKFPVIFCDWACSYCSFSKVANTSFEEPALLKGKVTLLCPMLFPLVFGAKWETGAGETSLLSMRDGIPRGPASAIITVEQSRPMMRSWLGLV